MVTYASYDFDHWNEAAHISFRRDDVPPRLPTDLELHRGEQVHVGASLWDRGNVVLGFYGQYHNQSNDRRYSTCDIGLVVSHDAIHFKEPVPDFKIVPFYEEPDWAEPRLLQGQGFENIGDRTFFWYGIWVAFDRDGPTGVRLAPGSVGLLRGSSQGEGSPFSFGSHPTSGEAAILLEKSGFRQRVSWRGKDRLQGLDRPFRIRVNWKGTYPEDARLYAVYVQGSE